MGFYGNVWAQIGFFKNSLGENGISRSFRAKMKFLKVIWGQNAYFRGQNVNFETFRGKFINFAEDDTWQTLASETWHWLIG